MRASKIARILGQHYRSCRQDRAGAEAVRGDLCLQRRQAVETLLRPQMLDEGDTQAASIEVAVEIEEIDLEAQILAAHGRAPAEIGGGIIPARAIPLGE